MTLNWLTKTICTVAVAIVLAGCGEPEKPRAHQRHALIGRGEFDDVGKVGLFQGESCATQIVFVFHGSGSAAVSLAAPFRVSKVLSDAAHNHKTVHVVGQWRHGKTPGCSYVEATDAELIQKSFW